MRFLRTISTRRLLALCLSAVAVAACGTAIALGAVGSGSKPPAKPLAQAAHDAITAPQVQGITARVKFTNHLIDSSGIRGANPLLQGADGRLWFAPGKGFRLELQSDNGDAQVVADQQRFFVYDGTSDTVYQGKVPQHKEAAAEKEHKVPSVARIQQGLNRAKRHKVDISGPVPGNIAGQPAYTVHLAPGEPGGLFGGVALAWDAAHGLPLRVAVYARGNSTPVLELSATEISYGPVSTSNFAINPPSGAHVVNVDTGGAHGNYKRDKAAAGKLPFKVSAPATLAGRKRSGLRSAHGKVAIVRYGKDLNGLLVIEKAAKPERPSGGRHQLDLPTANINGATAKVIDTPLGSVVTFQRGGVQYTVLGSVHASVAEAAARGL